jgi:hypothetical protein
MLVTLSRRWQYFVANLGLCCPSRQVGAYSRGKAPRKMAVTYQHFLLVGLLVALTGPAYAENAGPPPVPRFETAPCPKLPGADELAKASCGYLVVPENRSRPAGITIRLMVAQYPARSPEKRADPIVYLAGGPGDIAPLEVNGLIAADFIRDRDIVVMSQRGTMFSEPALTCAAIDNFNRELLGLRFYSEATERAHLAATKVCHQELAHFIGRGRLQQGEWPGRERDSRSGCHAARRPGGVGAEYRE